MKKVLLLTLLLNFLVKAEGPLSIDHKLKRAFWVTLAYAAPSTGLFVWETVKAFGKKKYPKTVGYGLWSLFGGTITVVSAYVLKNL